MQNQTTTTRAAVTAVLAAAKPARVKRKPVATDEDIRNLATESKRYKVSTTRGGGLFVFVTPKGAKSFAFLYENAQGVVKTHTLGKFGKLTLAMALGEFETARARLEKGVCVRTAQLEQRTRQLTTLADEFQDWFPAYRTTVGPDYAARTLSLFDSDDMAQLRGMHLGAIDAPTVLRFAKAAQVTRSKSFGRDVVNMLEKVYAHARLQGHHKGDNPALGVVKHLAQRDSQPFQALQLEQLPLYFQDLGGLTKPTAWRVQRPVSTVKSSTVLALKILPYITVRPSILRHAQWSWISWDGPLGAMLTVPAFVQGTKQRVTEQRADKRGKAYASYRVPLSRQVVSLLQQLQRETGASQFLFPGYKSRKSAQEKPISEGRWLSALRRMGWTGKGRDEQRGAITVHGFRALFATAASTRYVVTNQEEHALEFQQDHKLTAGVRAHYTRDKDGSHRGLLLAQRAAMLQWWADEIDAVLASQGGALPQSRADAAAAFATRSWNRSSPSVMN